MMKTRIVAAALAALAGGTAAIAAPPSGNPSACALTNIASTGFTQAQQCSGFYAGNLLSGSNAGITGQQTGLAAIGYSWDGNFANVTKINSLGGGTTVNWSTANQNPLTTMYGTTFVGLHFGNGAGLGGNVTGFFKFDAGTAGLQSFVLNILQGSSGAVLYTTGSAPIGGGGGSSGSSGGSGGGSSGGGGPLPGAVPEPATWAMLIAGFGLVGIAKRNRRSPVRISAA